MKPEALIKDEMKKSLAFLLNERECVKELDQRIRSTALYLASIDLSTMHPDVETWDLEEGPEDSMIRGTAGGKLSVLAKVKTMGLQGKSAMGGRQTESMRKAADQIKAEGAQTNYLFLLDPWTVNIVRESLKDEPIVLRPLLQTPVTAFVESTVERAAKPQARDDAPVSLVEEVITKDESIPSENIIVSPISRTSLRQGFLYVPKEKGALIKEGAITIWIRKDASIESRCMVSQTGGIRIGGNLTKWFKSVGVQADDELVMAAQADGSLLVMSIKRAQPFKGETPTVETVKWD
jgi:hypothetical protein